MLVVSAHGTIAIAVEAMREGAIDFIEKPFSPEVLRARVEKAVEIARERRGARTARARVEALEQDLERGHGPHGLVGRSEPMRRVLDQVRKVAVDRRDRARARRVRHRQGARRARHPRRARRAASGRSCRSPAPPSRRGCSSRSCSATSEGAFTGAVRRKLGRFELAHERDALPRRGRRDPAVGAGEAPARAAGAPASSGSAGRRRSRWTCGVVSATNRDLAQHGARRALPRGPLLPARTWCRSRCRRSATAPATSRSSRGYFLARLAPRHRPRGDRVRARGARAARAATAGRGTCASSRTSSSRRSCSPRASSSPRRPAARRSAARRPPPALPVPTGDRSLTDILEDLERQLILAAYEKARGVKAETARLLGIKPSALYYKLEKYGIVKAGRGRGEAGPRRAGRLAQRRHRERLGAVTGSRSRSPSPPRRSSVRPGRSTAAWGRPRASRSGARERTTRGAPGERGRRGAITTTATSSSRSITARASGTARSSSTTGAARRRARAATRAARRRGSGRSGPRWGRARRKPSSGTASRTDGSPRSGPTGAKKTEGRRCGGAQCGPWRSWDESRVARRQRRIR